MKRLMAAGLVASLLSWNAIAEHEGEMAKPEKEHEWMQQLAGEWTSEGEMWMEPGKDPMKNTGTESSKMIGGFWFLSEMKADMGGMSFTGIFTLGYDTNKKVYVATWIDSMTNYMWTYEGTTDEAGKVLTLNTSGPSPMDPTKSIKYKEVIEIQDKDHKTFTSYFDNGGEWVKMVQIKYTRKK